MSKIVINKLIRDRVVDEILKSGKKCETHVLKELDYKIELKNKLKEECDEVINANDKESIKEELADVVEVIAAMAIDLDVNLGEIIKIAGKKRARLGGFDSRIFLENIVD